MFTLGATHSCRPILSAPTMTEPIEVGHIEIRKYFDAASDDGAIIKVTYSDGLTLYDAVAMLSFAQATVFTDHVPEEQR